VSVTVTAVLAGFVWAVVGLAVGILLMTEYYADVKAFDEAVPL
jgi:ascorbate-specific PTS system EIIC-type component UlaA